LSRFFHSRLFEVLNERLSQFGFEEIAEPRARKPDQISNLSHIDVTMKITLDKQNSNAYFWVHDLNVSGTNELRVYYSKHFPGTKKFLLTSRNYESQPAGELNTRAKSSMSESSPG